MRCWELRKRNGGWRSGRGKQEEEDALDPGRGIYAFRLNSHLRAKLIMMTCGAIVGNELLQLIEMR